MTKVTCLSPAPCKVSLAYKWCRVEGGHIIPELQKSRLVLMVDSRQTYLL